MTDWDDYPEPHLDDLTREQLAEYDPMARAVADTLDEWLHRMHGITAGLHNAGAFLEFLALHGYTVTAMEPVTPLEELLPAPAPAYGSAVCIRQADGTVTVERADDRIGMTRDLVEAAGEPHRRADGLFQLDTAGEYVYRYLGGDYSDQGFRHDVLIFERVSAAEGSSSGPAETTEEGATTR